METIEMSLQGEIQFQGTYRGLLTSGIDLLGHVVQGSTEDNKREAIGRQISQGMPGEGVINIDQVRKR